MLDVGTLLFPDIVHATAYKLNAIVKRKAKEFFFTEINITFCPI